MTLARLASALVISASIFVRRGARTKIENAVFPIYLDFSSEPVAIVRAKKISTEYQRKGFFRIGVLPMLVCEAVRIELHDPQRVTNALNEVNELFETRRAGKALELRGVSLEFKGEVGLRLQAETVHLRDRGRWALSKASYRYSTNTVQIPEAVLEFVGSRAGRLAWTGPDGPTSANVFSPDSPNNSSNQDP